MGRHFRSVRGDTAAAWQEDGSLEGEVAFGSGALPSEYAAAITLMEFTVHGWDLAKATGQTLDLDPQTSAMAAMVTKQAAEGAPRGSDSFGPAMDAPAEGTSYFRGAIEAN